LIQINSAFGNDFFVNYLNFTEKNGSNDFPGQTKDICYLKHNSALQSFNVPGRFNERLRMFHERFRPYVAFLRPKTFRTVMKRSESVAGLKRWQNHVKTESASKTKEQLQKPMLKYSSSLT